MSSLDDLYKSQAKDFRKNSIYWDAVADLAKQEGDIHWASTCSARASSERQKAREIEVKITLRNSQK